MLFAEARVLKLQPKHGTATRIRRNPLSLLKPCSSFSTTTVEQVKDEEQKKQHTLNSILHDIGSTMSTDLNDYKIIKEGEAEILMHAKNEVFYNKTQVPKF